ncbi:hypothetical protein [Amycolatopsis sp. NPDC051716]|uniref:hypothetical protein n=1 Tax=Actinomycetes TaxID=1760 RepID=UPI00342DC979
MRSVAELLAIFGADDDAKRALARPDTEPTYLDRADGIVAISDEGYLDEDAQRGPAHGPRHNRRLARQLSLSHRIEADRW